jgi:glutamate carboxypeptidase
MLDLLEAMVRAESPSTDAAAQEVVFALLAASLHELGWRVRRWPGRTTGGCLLAYPPREKSQPYQLLVGHTDTVWPLGTLARQPFRRDGERLYGPGTFDTKAGLLQAVYALKALHALGLRPEVTPVLFLNSDEEIASPESEPLLRRLARRADRVLVLEPSAANGDLKTARKGVSHVSVEITGRAAHAGLDPAAGVSAILEASHVIQALHRLNNDAAGITVNPGVIRGGTRRNVIPEHCSLDVDVRAAHTEAAERAHQAILALQPRDPKAKLIVRLHRAKLPFEDNPGTQALLQRAQGHAEGLGFRVEGRLAGGASDGNTTAPLAPTLDGLGAVGHGAHAPDEHILVPHLAPRAALLAGLILDPPLRPPLEARDPPPEPPADAPAPPTRR